MVEKIRSKAGVNYRNLYEAHHALEKELEPIILRARKDFNTDIKINGYLDDLDVCICFSKNGFEGKFNFPWDIMERLRLAIPGFCEIHVGNHNKYNYPLVMRFYGLAKREWQHEINIELDEPNRMEQMFDFGKTLEYTSE